MKHFNLFVVAVFMLAVWGSCKKDDTPADEREKFVGVWKGSSTMTIPSLEMNETVSGTQTIKKSTSNSRAIIFDDNMSAVVDGNSYIYDEYSETVSQDGVTMTMEMNGGGVISASGNTITESGTVTVYMLGQQFSGTWKCTFTKL
ncbi:MAG: hypothetical protein LBV47_01600 [Bacteroidales bacterium]|nr:hypothetical protein [Bacteroidales bacterium]